MTIKLKNNVTLHKLQSKLSLFDGEKSVLYTFNTSAEVILNWMKLGWSKSKITEALKEKYGATKNEGEDDYTYVLNFLNEKKMIKER